MLKSPYCVGTQDYGSQYFANKLKKIRTTKRLLSFFSFSGLFSHNTQCSILLFSAKIVILVKSQNMCRNSMCSRLLLYICRH